MDKNNSEYKVISDDDIISSVFDDMDDLNDTNDTNKDMVECNVHVRVGHYSNNISNKFFKIYEIM